MRWRSLYSLVPTLLAVGCSDPIQLDDGTGDFDSASGPMSTSGPTTVTTAGPTTTPVPTTTPLPTSGPDTDTVGPVTTLLDSSTAPPTESDTTDLPDCPGVGEGVLDPGESCSSNEECVTALCLVYEDQPINVDAACEIPPDDCSMRITGTVLDIVTRQPVPGVDLVVASALQAASNPAGAMPLAMAVSGADGRIDTLSSGPIEEPIGVVALASGAGYELSTTAIASPVDGNVTHGVGNDIHDLWVVTEVALATWSANLALDPQIDPASLPLGAAGGVVGIARDGGGLPLAGISLVSVDPGSTAVVRYLDEDGSFDPDATSSLGLVVIIEPAVGEVFEGLLPGGTVVGAVTVFSAANAVNTFALDE